VADMVADGKDALPAGNRISPHDRMDCSQQRSDILRRPARFLVDLEASSLGCFVEVGTVERCGERLEELLDWCGDSVVDFVAGSPESV
jgi:alkanesulfonate monooxygenase SsuD/methylene tetrahydromethanopterin reductase-like flavin-dependent oxidoreductase (luciferase family)